MLVSRYVARLFCFFGQTCSAVFFCLFRFSFRRRLKVKAELMRFLFGVTVLAGTPQASARTNLEGDDQVDLLAHHHDELGSQMAREADLGMLWATHQTETFVLKASKRCKRDKTASLTHDLPDRDGLGERGGGAAPGDVDGHHSEQHLLPHWELLHLVLVPLHELRVGLQPLLSWRRREEPMRGEVRGRDGTKEPPDDTC